MGDVPLRGQIVGTFTVSGQSGDSMNQGLTWVKNQLIYPKVVFCNTFSGFSQSHDFFTPYNQLVSSSRRILENHGKSNVRTHTSPKAQVILSGSGSKPWHTLVNIKRGGKCLFIPTKYAWISPTHKSRTSHSMSSSSLLVVGQFPGNPIWQPTTPAAASVDATPFSALQVLLCGCQTPAFYDQPMGTPLGF
jgi:hypothetical protein